MKCWGSQPEAEFFIICLQPLNAVCWHHVYKLIKFKFADNRENLSFGYGYISAINSMEHTSTGNQIHRMKASHTSSFHLIFLNPNFTIMLPFFYLYNITSNLVNFGFVCWPCKIMFVLCTDPWLLTCTLSCSYSQYNKIKSPYLAMLTLKLSMLFSRYNQGPKPL